MGSFARLAGGVAVVLLASPARADEETAARTVEVSVEDGGAGRVAATPGEPVRLVFQRTSGPALESIVLPDEGVVAPLPLGQPVMLIVRSARGDIGYRVERGADAAAAADAAELAAGNTGGRG
jgi:plastocyanin domain-containing protein